MKMNVLVRNVNARLGALLLALAACAAWLSSCATGPESSGGAGVFKFSVLRYQEPVWVTGWVVDPAQSANPEGSALNITTAMQKGDVDFWLASWDAAERPARVSVLGRVVANADLVIELWVLDPQQKETKLQLPLKHMNGQWWLTTMDPTSEFLNWENSSNKIVEQMETTNLKTYLQTVQGKH